MISPGPKIPLENKKRIESIVDGPATSNEETTVSQAKLPYNGFKINLLPVTSGTKFEYFRFESLPLPSCPISCQ